MLCVCVWTFQSSAAPFAFEYAHSTIRMVVHFNSTTHIPTQHHAHHLDASDALQMFVWCLGCEMCNVIFLPPNVFLSDVVIVVVFFPRWSEFCSHIFIFFAPFCYWIKSYITALVFTDTLCLFSHLSCVLHCCRGKCNQISVVKHEYGTKWMAVGKNRFQ